VKKDGRVVWDIVVPSNTEAEVHLPDGKVESVGSGNYHYEVYMK
jgi:alpha-L-rhamnosidase